MAQMPSKHSVLNFQLLQSPGIIQPQDVPIYVLSSLVQACRWVLQTQKKVKRALMEEENLGPEIGRNWMQLQGQIGRKQMYLWCAWLYFEARYLSGRGVMQESSWNPFLYAPTLCLTGAGASMKDHSLPIRHGQHTQGCTGRRLNYFRKDKGRKCSRKSELLLNRFSLQEKPP